MAKVNLRNIESREKMKYLDTLWTSIAELKTREEVKNFFKDLLTPSESVMLARRILIAKLLLEGKTYEEIKEQLGVGVDTVAKVHRWVASGFGGYQKTIKRFEMVLEKRIRKIERRQLALEPYSFEWLKRKYPMHFLLFNIFDKLKGK